MANYWFKVGTGRLDALNSYFTDEDQTIPASEIPGVGDVLTIRDNGIVDTGTDHETYATVTNYGVINGGTFRGSVDNRSESGLATITGGVFYGEVTNSYDITGGTFHGAVIAHDDLKGGTYNGAVTQDAGNVFTGTVFNGDYTTTAEGIASTEIQNGSRFNGTLTIASGAGGNFGATVALYCDLILPASPVTETGLPVAFQYAVPGLTHLKSISFDGGTTTLYFGVRSAAAQLSTDQAAVAADLTTNTRHIHGNVTVLGQTHAGTLKIFPARVAP